MENFGRSVRVTFDGKLVAENLRDNGLRIAFRAFRTRQMQPQRFGVTIWGLGEAKEAEITTLYRQARRVAIDRASQGKQTTLGRVGIHVGRWATAAIPQKLELLIEGDLVDLEVAGEKPERALSFRGADGFNAWRRDYIRESLAGVPITMIEKVIAAGMSGSFDSVAAKAQMREQLADMAIKGTMSGGFVAHGRRDELVKKLAESMKVMAVKREGQGVLLRFDGVDLSLPAVVVSDATGLLGTPRVSGYGQADFETMLDAKLMPGRQVRLADGSADQTLYRIDSVEHSGDTEAGGTWTSSVTAWEPGTVVQL